VLEGGKYQSQALTAAAKATGTHWTRVENVGPYIIILSFWNNILLPVKV
jgi:hypothetical protein